MFGLCVEQTPWNLLPESSLMKIWRLMLVCSSSMGAKCFRGQTLPTLSETVRVTRQLFAVQTVGCVYLLLMQMRHPLGISVCEVLPMLKLC